MKAYIQAARLRTLPLVIGGILVGGSLSHNGNGLAFGLIFLTALSLQILSNFANDLGDFQKGTDQAAGREDRVMSAGSLSIGKMKVAIAVLAILALAFGLMLLMTVFEQLNFKFIMWFAIGLLAIGAAVNYTMGKKAYGYRSLGDFVVLLFFGWVAIIGTGYLTFGHWDLLWLLPATGYGLMSVGVLNINNTRDIESDLSSGKITIANRLGFNKALIYQRVVIILAGLCFVVYAFWVDEVFFYVGLLVWLQLLLVNNLAQQDPRSKFNQRLKFQAITSFIFGLMVYILSHVSG